MRDAFKRYKMYLLLKKENKSTFLVPCYDIDLVWHTHQVHPHAYQRDTNSILGFVLKHDDSVNDRAEGSKLNNADEVTRALWLQRFDVPFARPGSMFRGNPPYGRLHKTTSTFQKTLLAPKEMEVEVDSITLNVPSNVCKKIAEIASTYPPCKEKDSPNHKPICSSTATANDNQGANGNGNVQNGQGGPLSLTVQIEMRMSSSTNGMKTKTYTIYSGDCPPIRHLSTKPFANNTHTNGHNSHTNGNVENNDDNADDDVPTEMLGDPGGEDSITLENPPQGLVNFPANQGNQPKMILRFEKGRAKAVVPGLKKHTSFADRVSHIFGIGNSSKKANVIAYSEAPVDLFKLLNENDDFASSNTTESSQAQQEMRRRYQNIRLENRLLFMNTKVTKPYSFSSFLFSYKLCHFCALNGSQSYLRLCFCAQEKKNKKSNGTVPKYGEASSATGNSEGHMMADVRLNLSGFKVGTASDDVKFSVAPGAFYDCIIPEQVESLWGPIPLQHLPPGVDNKCRAVTHGYVIKR